MIRCSYNYNIFSQRTPSNTIISLTTICRWKFISISKGYIFISSIIIFKFWFCRVFTRVSPIIVTRRFYYNLIWIFINNFIKICILGVITSRIGVLMIQFVVSNPIITNLWICCACFRNISPSQINTIRVIGNICTRSFKFLVIGSKCCRGKSIAINFNIWQNAFCGCSSVWSYKFSNSHCANNSGHIGCVV